MLKIKLSRIVFYVRCVRSCVLSVDACAIVVFYIVGVCECLCAIVDACQYRVCYFRLGVEKY